MRNRILAIAAIAAAIGAPVAAQAQSETVGVVRGSGVGVVINDADGIAIAQRPAFREYVIRERVPTYTVPDRVIVAACCRKPASPCTTCRKPMARRRIATPW